MSFSEMQAPLSLSTAFSRIRNPSKNWLPVQIVVDVGVTGGSFGQNFPQLESRKNGADLSQEAGKMKDFFEIVIKER